MNTRWLCCAVVEAGGALELLKLAIMWKMLLVDRVVEAVGAMELLKRFMIYALLRYNVCCRGSRSDGAIETRAQTQAGKATENVVEAVRAMELLKQAIPFILSLIKL